MTVLLKLLRSWQQKSHLSHKQKFPKFKISFQVLLMLSYEWARYDVKKSNDQFIPFHFTFEVGLWTYVEFKAAMKVFAYC